MNNLGNFIEIIRFKVEAAKANDFVAARESVDAEVRLLNGFLGSELCMLDEENWVIFIRWENEEKMKSAQKITEKMQTITNWIAIAAQFVSFEAAEVKYSTIPHGVRICAKRYKKRVSKVRFESTKT